MKKFSNNTHKIKAILSVFGGGEKLEGDEIANRLKEKGYLVNKGNIRMFIYYNMLYKYLQKELRDGKNYYSLIN
ncbi:MAG TPA: hypothetical protein ENH28_06015 [Euryarchaeota archaeon]|nr:hypothetical protein BMS3Bbin15_00794 [archaeon BMS3Bbin15]HDL15688.1 hypothetical protein [Euryarchaeota archaeon]